MQLRWIETVALGGLLVRQLQVQINRLDQLGIDDPSVRSPQQLRAIAEAYYTGFRPVIELYD